MRAPVVVRGGEVVVARVVTVVVFWCSSHTHTLLVVVFFLFFIAAQYDLDDDLDELTFSSNTEDFDRVWDAELDEEEDDEQEQEVFDTSGPSIGPMFVLVGEKHRDRPMVLSPHGDGPRQPQESEIDRHHPHHEKVRQSVKESAGAPLSKYMLPQIGGAPIGFHWSTHGEGGVHFGTKDYFFKAQCYPRFGKE